MSHGLLCAAILGTTWSVGDLVLPLAGGEKAVVLAPPRVTIRLHTEEVMEEVLRRGILVQAAYQIGNGTVEILGLDHWRIEQQTSGFVLDSPRLVIGHTLQHFELYRLLNAVM